MEGGGEALARTVASTAPQLGWGVWDIHVEPDLIRLEVRNSPFAAGFGASDSPVCSPILGMMRAISGMIFGREAIVHETSCVACGQDLCRFEARPREAA
jgi:predicted hydrocarbon binding protein